LLEDVTISNITMRDVVNSPIFIRLGKRARGPKETTTVGELRRVIISNIVAYNAEPKYASIISGIPERKIDDLRLSNIRIYYKGGGTREQAALVPPENEAAYPEPVMFGEMPAYGFFIRHVKSLTMTDIELSFLKDDARPAFVLNNVQGADFHRVKAQRVPGNSVFFLKNVTDFSINQFWQLADTRLEKVVEKTF
jgi:polygalacturonase